MRASSSPTPSLWRTGLAFRPFFYFGACFAALCLLAWQGFWMGHPTGQPLFNYSWWHQHEMLFGFSSAIIAGFLLTAVQTWTGLPSLRGASLWALVALWLLARITLFYSAGLPLWLVAVIDLAFIPLTAWAVGRLVIKAQKWRNLIFVPVLVWLSLSNLGMYYGATTNNYAMVQHSAYLAIWLVVSLMVVLGGRVIPFFTSRGLQINVAPAPKWREALILISILVFNISLSVQVLGVAVPKPVFSIALGLLVVLNAHRLLQWAPLQTLKTPLLWSLQLSYVFIILGMALWGVSLWTRLATDIAVHTLTIGAILAMILSMMSRVSLGHTGRALKVPAGFNLAMLCVFAAAIVRGIGLVLWPNFVLGSYHLSLTLSIVAMLWFAVQYAKPLWTPRPDHKPG